MNTTCKCLKQNAIKIVNFKKKKVIPLTTEQLESHEKTKKSAIFAIKVRM